MKELTGLDDKLAFFESVAGEGDKLISPTDPSKGTLKDTMPTYRNLFRNMLAGANLKNKEKAIVAYDLCDSLKETGETFVIEDEELSVLRTVIETAGQDRESNLPNHMWAQLLKKVNSAKPTKRPTTAEEAKLPEGAIPLDVK